MLRLVFDLARQKQYPKANRPEYNERPANLRLCQQLCYSFFGIPLILWVVFIEIFWIHRFFS